jgi:inorganic pyrophosphatase
MSCEKRASLGRAFHNPNKIAIDFSSVSAFVKYVHSFTHKKTCEKVLKAQQAPPIGYVTIMNIKANVPFLAILLSLASSAVALAEWVHPFDYPQPEEYPEEINAVIEIPAGSYTKYEIDAETGHVIVDRFQSMSVQYPANYGSISQSAGGDGDPLDVLVITRTPIAPGSIIRVRPVGILMMIDGGEVDDKIVAVPAASIDPTYNDILDINDLPEIERQRIEEFFNVYKRLPEGSDVVELRGFDSASAAQLMVEEAIDRYRSDRGIAQTSEVGE